MKKNTLLRSAIFFLTAFLNVCAAIGNQLPYYHSKEEFINASRNKLINDRSFQYKIEQRKENDYKQLGNYLKSSIENFDEAFVNSIYDLKKKEQRALEKELQKGADWIIELLNQRIAKNTQLLKEGNDTETDYILDMRRSYGGSNEFISESKENILNVELRDLHKTTGKAIYVVLSPIFPEQLSYGAQAQDKTSGKLTKTAKDYTFYTSSFNEQERKRFAQKYTNYIAERSHLSNKSTSGGILHIESLMRYDALKKKWCMNFMDFMAFSKNINPQVAAKVAEDIRRDKTRKAIAFTNYTQVLESSLSDYVEVISWNWRAAFVDVNAKNRPNYPMGKYKVLLSQLSVEDKKSIKNILDKQNPSTYSPAKGNLTDYANMESYLEKIISAYTSRSRNTHGVKLKIITTSDKNNPGGMNAMQLAGNENPSAKTVVLGFHFSEENGNVWLYWNVKYSTDLANALPQNLMDNLWREVGSSTIYDKSINLYYDFVDNVVLPAVDSGKYIVAWGLERAYQFMDMLLAIYEAGRIPESWYTNGGWMTFPGGPLLAGILNALIDDIVGIYELAKLALVDIPGAICDGIASISSALYDYSTDKAYRDAVNSSLRQLANSTFEFTRGLVQTVAFATGYQYIIFGNVTPAEYETPEVINKLVTNLKSIDIEELDSQVTTTLSTPFVWFGNKLEGCYGYGATGERKLYCSGYLVVSVALCFTGIEEIAIAGRLAKGAEIAKAFTKLRLKDYIDKLLGVSKKVYKAADETLYLLLKRIPPWATDLVTGAKSIGAKVEAVGNDIVIYTKNGLDELCRVTADGVKNVKNWIDEKEIKVTYPRYSLKQAVYVTEGGEKINGPIVLMKKDDGEFFFKRNKKLADDLSDLLKNEDYKKIYVELKNNPSLRKHSEIFTLEEEAVFKFYTNKYYYKFNQALLDGSKASDILAIEKLLNSGLAKITSSQVKCYRGIGKAEIDIIKKFGEGGEINYLNFLSSTSEAEVAWRFFDNNLRKTGEAAFVEIVSKSGKRIDLYSDAVEFEILHHSKSKFKIKKIEVDDNYIRNIEDVAFYGATPDKIKLTKILLEEL
jgi:hypothetical protein